jgi:hypothetical protein
MRGSLLRGRTSFIAVLVRRAANRSSKLLSLLLDGM